MKQCLDRVTSAGFDTCREGDISYVAHTTYKKKKIIYKNIEPQYACNDIFTHFEGPAKETIYHLGKGTKLPEHSNILSRNALHNYKLNGEQIEAVLNNVDVTVWNTMIFGKNLTCEIVFWREGRSTEFLGPQLLGIEVVDNPFYDENWVWAGLYDNNNKLIDNGCTCVRDRPFNEEALKMEIENPEVICVASKVNSGARWVADENLNQPFVEIVAGKYGKHRVIIKGIRPYEYDITRPRCLEIIEQLKSGKMVKMIDKKTRKNMNIRALFQNNNKGGSKDNHSLFEKNHIASMGNGFWKIVAERV